MKEQPLIEVTEVPVGDLVPYARNAKIHTNEQVDQIVRSIEEFGFNDPIGVWEDPEGDLEIVEGHGRVLAAKKLGLDVVPVIYLNHLSDEQRRAYALAHNKINMNTGWAFSALDAELEELSAFDMEAFGFELMPEFDAIGDLMENDFASASPKDDAETFNVTFTFPASERGSVADYLKGFWKGNVVERIVEEARAWA